MSDATTSQLLKDELRGIGFTLDYLKVLDSTTEVDVPDDETQRNDAVDILWSYAHLGQQHDKRIKVRVDDEIHQTGNFLFEYVEDVIRGTPGYFPRTKADLLYYLAIETGQLFILEVEKVRRWFENEISRFPKHFQNSTTVVRQENGLSVTSFFYFVPLVAVEANTPLYRRTVQVA